MLARRQIVEQGHAGGAAVECNDVVRQFMARLQALDHMHPDALVLEQDVADAQHQDVHPQNALTWTMGRCCEIGRASDRESVVPYVYISVNAASFKKQY